MVPDHKAKPLCQGIDLPRSNTQACASTHVVGDILGDANTSKFSNLLKLNVFMQYIGADGETRTLTMLPPGDFESPASTIPPHRPLENKGFF